MGILFSGLDILYKSTLLCIPLRLLDSNAVELEVGAPDLGVTLKLFPYFSMFIL